jgi:hypothetical protein
MIDFKFTKMPPPPEKVIKSLNFGIARGLTKTAGEGSASVHRGDQRDVHGPQSLV